MAREMSAVVPIIARLVLAYSASTPWETSSTKATATRAGETRIRSGKSPLALIAHQAATIAEKHRLVYAVGDEEHRLFRRCAQACELFLKRQSRHRVDRREWFVHQDDLGVGRPRPRDRYALAHAAGKLVRIALLESRQPGQ